MPEIVNTSKKLGQLVLNRSYHALFIFEETIIHIIGQNFKKYALSLDILKLLIWHRDKRLFINLKQKIFVRIFLFILTVRLRK